MNTPRLDILTPIHKALRRSLFETAIALARTDFESGDEATAAEAAVAACFAYLREHAEHEDRHVIPEIARLDAELANALAFAHPELERASIAIESLWPRMAPLAGAERAAMGAELCRRFQAFVAMQLEHMDKEERNVLPALQGRFNDEELNDLSARIVSEIPPARMAVWGQLIGPSLNRREREGMQQRRAA
jgi:hemerythrin-like domain-containing protein